MPDSPKCQIRYSRRAKRIRLRVSAEDGLIATLPKGMPMHMLHSFLDEQRDWIHHTLNELQPLRQQLETERRTLPATLDLRAFDREFRICYKETPGSRLRLDDQGETLVVRGLLDDISTIHKALGNHVRRQAKSLLGAELERLSKHHGLTYNGYGIRRQKTRWGSCSASGKINLNDTLLFLPRHLMQHVLLHELAHTRHLDHSGAFYQLLHSLDPQTPEHHQALRQAGKYIPLWLRWA